ncbi:hypothetical protein EDC01DRAFT_635310 [Geopyxis carbonaria]|nr:hypothetical protein EDC01DRAFT_635310 [Geopyxis carbonaria]
MATSLHPVLIAAIIIGCMLALTLCVELAMFCRRQISENDLDLEAARLRRNYKITDEQWERITGFHPKRHQHMKTHHFNREGRSGHRSARASAKEQIAVNAQSMGESMRNT